MIKIWTAFAREGKSTTFEPSKKMVFSLYIRQNITA
jgi:hypothetical protein